MERTKYTPKRLLSLLLALIMLLGMFPTAALAAEPAGGIVLNSDEYKAHGLIFKFEPILPDGPYIMGESKDFRVHYTISTATGDDYVEITELKQFARYSNAQTGMIAGCEVKDKKASDPAYSEITKEVTPDGSQPVRVFNPGVVIVEGDITDSNSIISDENNTGRLLQRIYFAAEWHGVSLTDIYNTNETVGETSIKTMTVSARYLPLGYSVSYNDGGYTGTAGIPVGTFRTTGSGKDNQSFTISDVTPTLAGCTFKGWSSDTWENKDADGNPVLFQPGDTVEKVGADTVLTAIWEPTETANTHTVSFVADVTGVSQLPDAINVEHDTVIPGEKVPTVPPIREGYNFLHWTDNLTTKANYDFTQKITADVKLYPVWTRNQVKITWPLTVPTGVTLRHKGTGNPDDTVTSVDVGTEVTLQIVLDERYEIGTVTAGDRVLGSTVNGNIYTYTFTADKDLTVAVGDPTVKKFTISLPQGDGYEATFTDCTKFGFSGFGPALTEAEGATSYTFEYGDSFKIKLEAYADTTATLRVDGEEEFKVDGNSAETEKTTGAYTVNKMYNITVGTKRKITRMVTFSLEPYGGLYTIMPVENGNKIYAPAKPEIPGYEFGGWYQDAKFTQEWKFLPDPDATLTDAEKEAQTNAADVVKGNIVIYGKLTPKTYAVNYDANANGDTTVNGIPAAQTKTHGVALPLTMTNPTRDGHTFKGWATSAYGSVISGTTYEVSSDTTFYAIWESKEYSITVTYGKATIGAGSEISKAAEGTAVTLTANAVPSGKVFDKWEVVSGGITLADANSATTTFTMPASAVSVKATYKNAPHTHTYNQETVKPEALKTPADCTSNAVYFKSCSCGAISTTDTFVAMNTALGHAYGSDWKYDSTNHWHECSRCHDKKDEAAHDYGSDNVCDTCGYYKTVPHTHNLTLVAAKAATCTEGGKEAYYKCEGCGKFYEDVLGTKEITDLASWGNIAKIAHTTKQTVTKATPTANGKIVNYCSVCKKTLSTTVIPKASSIKLKATSLTYNGKVRTPKVIVKDRTGKTLVKNTDYTVSYAKGRKYVGKYAVKITFKGKYSGTKTLYFTIKPKATSISSLKAGSKKFTVKWKKQATQTTGYQVQYSASSKFSKAKTVTVGKNTTVSKKISKLSGKKKYYVRVRTYKTVKINGKSIRIYSGWSKAKTVTTKK